MPTRDLLFVLAVIMGFLFALTHGAII